MPSYLNKPQSPVTLWTRVGLALICTGVIAGCSAPRSGDTEPTYHEVRAPKSESSDAVAVTSKVAQRQHIDVPAAEPEVSRAPSVGADDLAEGVVQEPPIARPLPRGPGVMKKSKGSGLKNTAQASRRPVRHRPRHKAAMGAHDADAGALARLRGHAGSGGPSPADFGRAPLEASRDAYAHVAERDFVEVSEDPLSTFSIDVDTASYANMRRFIRSGQRPPIDAVRVEELINYFTYDYPQPGGDAPFSVTTEVGPCPWNSKNLLVHVGLQGKKIEQGKIPARNLVFLLDVSGSMRSSDRLPLLIEGLNMLTAQLTARDRVAIVVYAGASGLVLPPTPGSDKATISAALRRLSAGGSTNGAAGIRLAYQVAQQSMIQGGINRVILATDGDFNVGTSSEGELVRMIEKQRETGVHLSVLGFGRGNLNDSTMEQLADKGNGNYAYIDGREEARKVLVQEAGSTLVTIAKDVKIQVEFNPAHVASQRLVGYENRTLAHQDFRNDKKDAGEIGAGHSVTALYEIVLRDPREAPQATGSELRYQRGRQPSAAAASDELLSVALRYKAPHGQRSREFSVAVSRRSLATERPSADFRFSAAVAEFAQLLRGSKYIPEASFAKVRRSASSALGEDRFGHRKQFVDLVRRAERLVPQGHLARGR